MFARLLVANRGEIACRIFRTCRRMGLQTVAVYSDADAGARHVREADAAVRIGAAPARDSYLDARAIVDAALAAGAQAVHPGYGFLSERLDLIDACAAAGLAFVGPHRDAIARMGSKIESKRIARAAGLPCVPGYDGDEQDDRRLADEAARIGFPLLIKASAGGGGKGMKRVGAAAEFPARLAEARAEAMAAFGDDRVLLERFIERPRHLEVQLLGDRHGGLVHLFERECSIQRRYQKLVEEAPAAHLAGAVRERLFDAALSLGRAIGYDSAGTVEFVLDADRGDEPYFLEMNTRLQVEHPVTELTTGIDLVEAQIRSAAGEPLPFAQAGVRRSGWAIEARVNAEVPAEDFRASFGPVRAYAEPSLAGVRMDSGIDARSEVTPHYDALLAKLIAHGATRAVARERLRLATVGLRIEGVRTNQPLLAAVLAHPAFDAVLTTRFLGDTFPVGWREPDALQARRAAVAAAAWFFAATIEQRSDLPLSTLVGFRATAPAGRRARLSLRVGVTEGDARLSELVELECLAPRRVRWTRGLQAHDVDGVEVDATGALSIALGEDRFVARVEAHEVGLWCCGDWQAFEVHPLVRARRVAEEGRVGASADRIVAHLPGIVTRLLVAPGRAVRAGEAVAVIEAMKLLHTLIAPRDGTVATVAVQEGDTVRGGALLVELAS